MIFSRYTTSFQSSNNVVLTSERPINVETSSKKTLCVYWIHITIQGLYVLYLNREGKKSYSDLPCLESVGLVHNSTENFLR